MKTYPVASNVERVDLSWTAALEEEAIELSDVERGRPRAGDGLGAQVDESSESEQACDRSEPSCARLGGKGCVRRCGKRKALERLF